VREQLDRFERRLIVIGGGLRRRGFGRRGTKNGLGLDLVKRNVGFTNRLRRRRGRRNRRQRLRLRCAADNSKRGDEDDRDGSLQKIAPRARILRDDLIQRVGDDSSRAGAF
jgi:hypothetical protein